MFNGLSETLRILLSAKWWRFLEITAVLVFLIYACFIGGKA